MGLIDGMLNLFESGLETVLEAATNSIPGAMIDSVMGRGGDGVPYSSAENFVRNTDAGAAPVININTDAVTMNAAYVQAERETAPVQEVTQHVREMSVEDWFHATREQAQADALRSTAEARADADIAAGREQSLIALATDPVGFYAQRDAQEAAWYDATRQQHEAQQENQLSMGR